jgi:hypothetical protein
MHRDCHRTSCTHHDFHFSRVVARLRPDVSLASALSQVGGGAVSTALQNLHAPVAEDVASKTLIEDLAQDVKKPLIILLCAVACMLLIGCLNVANLLVARSAARQKEIAIRSALGARRITLIRVQLMESLLISIAGGAAGVLLSFAATKWLASYMEGPSQCADIHTDGVVLAFACALIVAAALLAGCCRRSHRRQERDCRAAGFVAERGRQPVAHGAAQDAADGGDCLTVVLLIAAGLLLKSFWRLRTTDIGCAIDNVLTMSYSLPAKKYDSPKSERIQRSAAGASARPAGCTRRRAGHLSCPERERWRTISSPIPEHPPIAAGAALPDALLPDGRSRILQRIADTAAERALLHHR